MSERDGMIALTLVTGMATVLAQAPSHVADTLPRTLPSPKQAKAEVVACGLPAARVSVRYQRDMQEDVVWISGSAPEISDDVLICISRASLKTSYYIFLRDSVARSRYDEIYYRISNEANVAHARQWLSSRNLLSAMPEPIKGEPLAKYAEAVEAFCGVRKGALLAVVDEHMITFAPGGLGRPSPNGIEEGEVDEPQFECVMNTTSAADLHSRGVFFGFIGNAAEAQ